MVVFASFVPIVKFVETFLQLYVNRIGGILQPFSSILLLYVCDHGRVRKGKRVVKMAFINEGR